MRKWNSSIAREVLKIARRVLCVSYRQVDIPPAHWFTAGVFRKQGRGEKVNVRSLLEKRSNAYRSDSQAPDQSSESAQRLRCRLIEISGLKGLRIGGAQVSMQHANFIVNDRQACAKDIETLIEKARGVADHTGIP